MEVASVSAETMGVRGCEDFDVRREVERKGGNAGGVRDGWTGRADEN